ncbi:MAG: hypothetical protein QXH60_03035, partial [Candidatus Pacearchaeota archaeon]
PLEWAFKFILSVIILLTPISFYYFLRSFDLSKEKSSIVALCLYALLFMFPNEHYGGNFHATFNVGLVANALALVLLFFYLGALNKCIKTKNYILPSIFFSLLLLSHIFTAISGAIAAVVIFIISSIKDKKNINYFIKHFLLSFGLAAFWIIPFFAKFSYTSAGRIGLLANIGYYVLEISLVFLIASWVKKRKVSLVASGIVLAITIFIIVGDWFLALPLHFYRFQLIIYIFLLIAVISWFEKDNYLIYIFIAAVAFFVIFTVKSFHPEGVLHIDKINLLPENIDGRVLIVASYDKQPSPHIFQHKIPMINRVHTVRGLYVESSKNSKYVFDLEKEIDYYKSLVWGVITDDYLISKNETVVQEILPYQFNLMNINYVVTFYKRSDKWEDIKRISFFTSYDGTKLERFYYDLYKVSNSSLIEILNYTPKVISDENWDYEVAKWSLSENIKNGVLVNEPVPNLVGTGKEKVAILEMSPTQEHIKFSVESDKDVPILIKISEFPNWKAYVNGKETKIYRASPYIMLIYGKGMIELKYETTWSDNLGNAISIITIILLIYLIIKHGKNNKKIRKY